MKVRELCPWECSQSNEQSVQEPRGVCVGGGGRGRHVLSAARRPGGGTGSVWGGAEVRSTEKE